MRQSHGGGKLTHHRVIRIRRGLDLPITGAPEQRIENGAALHSVALLGRDYRGLRPEVLVQPGEPVVAGQPLVRDRRHPGLCLVAPGSGKIDAIRRGARRRIASISIALEGDDALSFDRHEPRDVARETAQQQLLASGLWLAFRTRPFSCPPVPGSVPAAIFVTAMDSNPIAADPAVVLSGQHDSLRDGIEVLCKLTDGRVYFCRGPGLQIDLAGLPSQVLDTEFSGPHPAGLPGTHIHFLDPAGPGKVVWHIGYQDVVEVGRLFRHGRPSWQRVVALGGPSVRRPLLVRTRVGASTGELLADNLRPGPVRIISGPLLGGYLAAGDEAYLGRFHQQVVAVPEAVEREFLGWLAPGFGKFSATGAFVSSFFRRRRMNMNTSLNGSGRALLPMGNFEKVMPLDIVVVPLLKSLLVGDKDTARKLGALELDEEDLGLCTFACCSKIDYGPALREVLDQLERDG